jgi:Kef-type K+ transport system membrane component KefB
MLKELGLGMLFLLAGYELDPAELTGRGGRRALVTWLCCLATAFGVIFVLSRFTEVHAETAAAIALTSTALGTLLPILQDRGLVNTRLGRTILNHGAFGELGPVIAMAVLLGAHGAGAEVLVLLLFAVLAAVVAAVPRRILREGSHALTLVRLGADSNSQTTVRLTLLLLVSLIALAAVFDLDIILGAFAAGFILRRFMPTGDEKLEAKLNGLAYGLLIPVFFVVSGMNIDIEGVISRPGMLIVIIALLILCRGVPVFIATRWEREGRAFDLRERTQIALYSATGLPLLVAVTTVAVQAGDMSPTNASVIVAAGAITVLVFPAVALLLGRGEVESDREHRTSSA